jgi:hypothetical protein
VAEKFAVLTPAGTVTEAGTVTALLLLDRLTLNPPDGAALVSATVQGSVTAPVSAVLLHETALNETDVLVGVPLTPFPLSFTVATGVDDPADMRLNWPVESTTAWGLKWTFRLTVLPGAMFTAGPPWPSTVKAVFDKLSCETSIGEVPWFATETI